ncbi:MAG TPA: arginine--tRNA ligase, partial [Cryomorphaceae bacterium]|nr:arginine--tRNA ligase [Cryomorphaceae bacterium]
MADVVLSAVTTVLNDLYGWDGPVELQPTRKDFEGDATLVVFPFLKLSRKSPVDTAREIGEALQAASPLVSSFNAVQGFLNIVLSSDQIQARFDAIRSADAWGTTPVDPNAPAAMVEFSSPNTNKPLHLGHVRNILLGHSVSRILEASGRKVVQVQIVNDRGVHICKSMWAWQQFGGGITPDSAGKKGDHLVGNFYVRFDQEFRSQVRELMAQGRDEDAAKAGAQCMLEVQEMLRQWEAGDTEVRSLWATMNGWVYDGFNQTYSRLGVRFDRNYYESDTYVLGKQDIEEGLARGVFYRRDDGSVWIDLREDGLDEKLVLRRDGTSVYMTQDIGTAIQRFKDFSIDRLTYVVGNEQDYHFKVLFLILKKLGYAWADQLFHLSYGMVDLPSGKMKSREGTVVDADDLLDEMESTARALSEELGKTEGLGEAEKAQLYRVLGHGALKYFILKVDPRKRMVFNPEESIDFNGHTGPFIQYSHARIKSILRKAEGRATTWNWSDVTVDERSKELIQTLDRFPQAVEQAARAYSPAVVAQFAYDLAKAFNAFYQSNPILNAESDALVAFRVELCGTTASALRRALE